MMPAPAHLKKCTTPVKSKSGAEVYVGQVACPCGGRDFQLLHSGWLSDYRGASIPIYDDLDGRTVFIIEARCVACKKKHLLLDIERHGWNGFVCGQVGPRKAKKKPPMTAWQCDKCKGSPHAVTVQVVGEDMETAIEESDGLLTEKNWQEGFGAINFSIKCSSCGHKPKIWVQAETM